MKYIFIFILLAILLSSNEVLSINSKGAHNKTNKKKNVSENYIYNLKSHPHPRTSYFKTLTLDLLIPGGGHYYRGDNYLGTTFLFLKLTGLTSIAYFYTDYKYTQSKYRAAKNANESLDEYHDLKFKDSKGRYKSVRDYKREYDRSSRNLSFAVSGTIIIYMTSLLLNYYYIHEQNSKSIPTFEFDYSYTPSLNNDHSMVITYTHKLSW
mgnify:CR=1 FL=1